VSELAGHVTADGTLKRRWPMIAIVSAIGIDTLPSATPRTSITATSTSPTTARARGRRRALSSQPLRIVDAGRAGRGDARAHVGDGLGPQ